MFVGVRHATIKTTNAPSYLSLFIGLDQILSRMQVYIKREGHPQHIQSQELYFLQNWLDLTFWEKFRWQPTHSFVLPSMHVSKYARNGWSSLAAVPFSHGSALFSSFGVQLFVLWLAGLSRCEKGRILGIFLFWSETFPSFPISMQKGGPSASFHLWGGHEAHLPSAYCVLVWIFLVYLFSKKNTVCEEAVLQSNHKT